MLTSINEKNRIRIVASVFLVAVALVGLSFSIHYSYSQPDFKWDKLRLGSIRHDIEIFKGLNQRYPISLVELCKFMPENRDSYKLNIVGGDSFGIGEHDTLDGTGGYFYNPSTGEVRVNLNGQVKQYFKWYFGPERNEKPSEW
jgi:hypothetical protein